MYFDGVHTDCNKASKHLLRVSEKGKFAAFTPFAFVGDTLLDGYLQSYKYFDSQLRDTLRFKHSIVTEAEAYLQPFQSFTTIGVHGRRGDMVSNGKITLPPAQYFRNTIAYFRSKYAHVQFVVVSEDPIWCSEQEFFLADDVHIVSKHHTPAQDMAILSGCDHMVLSAGTFGWWAAYLGADAKGGEVLYYDSEFKEWMITNGQVVLADYYPEGWVGLGDEVPSAPMVRTGGEPFRVMLITTTSKEHDDGTRGTIKGASRLHGKLLPSMVSTITSLLGDGGRDKRGRRWTVDVHLIAAYSLAEDRRREVEDILREAGATQVTVQDGALRTCERAKRASFGEDENTRDDSTPAKWL